VINLFFFLYFFNHLPGRFCTNFTNGHNQTEKVALITNGHKEEGEGENFCKD
jgi:hypothetical protein